MAESDSKYTIKMYQARAITWCKKHVFACYMVPPRAIKIMTYFVKHPVSNTETRLYPNNTPVIDKYVPKLKD